MTAREERQRLVDWIDEAHAAGARLAPACREAGITVRTLQRWRDGDGQVHVDRRPEAVRPPPAHALGAQERAEVMTLLSRAARRTRQAGGLARHLEVDRPLVGTERHAVHRPRRGQPQSLCEELFLHPPRLASSEVRFHTRRDGA